MHRLWDAVVGPLLAVAKPKGVVEIGSDRGDNTRNLLELTGRWAGSVEVIDPAPKYDVDEWRGRYGSRLRFHLSTSLEALPQLAPGDAYLIDGDHNWYTVYNELKLIARAAAARKPERFPLILLHDTAWPYGRRDLYYDPATIPQRFRQPFRKAGMLPASRELADEGGLNRHLDNALVEGGRRNGVLTAVEDFLRESDSSLETFSAPAFHGLTAIASKARLQKSPRLASLLAQLRLTSVASQLVEALELSRVEADALRQTEEQRHDAQLAEAKARAEAAKAHIEGYAARLEEAKTARDAFAARSRELLELRTRAEERAQSLKERLVEAHGAYQALKESKALAATEGNAAKALVAELEERLRVASARAKTIAGLEDQLRLARLDRRIDTSAHDIDVARLQAAESEGRARELDAKARAAEANAKAAAQRVATLEEALGTTADGLDAAKADSARVWLRLKTLLAFRHAFDTWMKRQVEARFVRRWLPRQATERILRRLERRIEAAGAFDAAWYLQTYKDVHGSARDALSHYVRYGVFEGRDPSAAFSTVEYLADNRDVLAAGLNPLLHYATNGAVEGRPARRPAAPRRARVDLKSGAPMAAIRPPARRTIDVVVPVFNALEDCARCLFSVLRHGGEGVRLLVINDGSDAQTTHWLRWFAGRNRERVRLVENDGNLGYTRSINRGLRESAADYVVLLNSDTIVTAGWLQRLCDCADSDPRIGIVGPLSNAASWQSVPALTGADGKFAVNALPEGATPDEMAEAVAAASARRYPRVPFVNGFCYLMTRRAIEAVGAFDEDNFPRGYGEENDYSLRAGAAGFQLAIADDTYVYHAKSRSFGHAEREALSKKGNESLNRKHGQSRVADLVSRIRHSKELADVREAVARALKAQTRRTAPAAGAPLISLGKVDFLMPVSGGGGGAHSVIQEATAMRSIGVDARVLVAKKHLEKLLGDYRAVPAIGELLVPFEGEAQLAALTRDTEVLIATIFTSVAQVAAAARANPGLIPAYYVQDYEALFFEPDNARYAEALQSYALLPAIAGFAKTEWTCQQIVAHHGLAMERVIPSIDHGVYHARGRGRADGRIGISAMIRPHTPRRGAHRTMRVLRALAARFGERVSIDIFGCDAASLKKHEVESGFAFNNHGVLLREGVAELLRQSDVFLDLSDYQAFGRTAAEAMACGCVVLVTDRGGANEFCRHGENGFLVDVLDEASIIERASAIVDDAVARSAMAQKALLTASRYSATSAALSEIAVFLDLAAARRSAAQPANVVSLRPNLSAA